MFLISNMNIWDIFEKKTYILCNWLVSLLHGGKYSQIVPQQHWTNILTSNKLMSVVFCFHLSVPNYYISVSWSIGLDMEVFWGEAFLLQGCTLSTKPSLRSLLTDLSASLQTLWPSHEKQVSISKVFHWLLNFNIFLHTNINWNGE